MLSLQNGVENEARLAERLGLPPLLGAITHIGAELVGPGRRPSRLRRTDRLRRARRQPQRRASNGWHGSSPRAGVHHHVSRNIAVMLWDKLAWNAAFNACTAITRRTVGELLAHRDGRALARAAMVEVVAVARADGVRLDPARIEPEIERSARELGHLRTSMLQDRDRGRRLEHDALNGAVLRAAARGGVAAPVNQVLFAILDGLSG